MLTGKYRAGKPKPPGTRITEMEYFAGSYTVERLERLERLITFAETRGHTILELAFGWLLSHKVVSSVIAGATSAGQVEGNAKAGGWVLTLEEVTEVNAIVG